MPQPHASPECRWLAELFFGNGHHNTHRELVDPSASAHTDSTVRIAFLSCPAAARAWGAFWQERLGALFGNFDLISVLDVSHWSSYISRRQRLLMQMQARHVSLTQVNPRVPGLFVRCLKFQMQSFSPEIKLHCFCVSASSCSELHDARHRSIANANTITKYTCRSLHTGRTYLSIK